MRNRPIKIGTQLARHARYALFQIIEMAARREALAGILKPIKGLRGPPAAMAFTSSAYHIDRTPLTPVAIGHERGLVIRRAQRIIVVAEQSGLKRRHAIPVAIKLRAQPSEVGGGATAPDLTLADCAGGDLDVAAG